MNIKWRECARIAQTYVIGGQRFSLGGEDVVAHSAVRFIACAGMLATGLLMGGAGTGIAFADTGDTAGAEPETASLTSTGDSGSDGATGATTPDPPTSIVGNGREDVDVKSTQEERKKNGSPAATTKYKGSLYIPILRIPARAELPASGFPNPALFWTTVEIPVPRLAEVLAAMQPQPAPSPAPGPAFRTQEEAPPVVDSAGGGGGGGVDPLAAGVAAAPPVLQAPMVIAPLPIPLPPARPVAPLGAATTAGPTQAVVADVAAAGARAPVIRGSLPPTAEPAASSLTPMSGQTPRLGYPRYLRNPTPGELAIAALPGTAGLLVLTFTGGVIGYRQANSARFLRTEPAARFLR